MFSKLNFKKERGISLIELLAVMAIMGLMAAIVLPNYFSAQKKIALNRSAEKLIHDIRRAQEMAMSAKEGSGCSAGYKYGYGIVFSTSAPSSYRIFADCEPGGDFVSPPDKVVDTINFESGITIDSFGASTLSIAFTPPLPSVSIHPNFSTATITIKNSVGGQKSITVNKAGLIDDQ